MHLFIDKNNLFNRQINLENKHISNLYNNSSKREKENG